MQDNNEPPRFRPVPWSGLETPADVELWIEDWHGRDLPYAECLTDEGTGSRVWFHRDKPGTPMGVTGRILPNALF